MSYIKALQDTRKISIGPGTVNIGHKGPDGATVSSTDPYFTKPSLWRTGYPAPAWTLTKGQVDLNIFQSNVLQTTGINSNSPTDIGFIIDVKCKVGTTIRFYETGNTSFVEFVIPCSGRYEGVCSNLKGDAVALYNYTNPNRVISVFEFFTFDAKKFSYKDFLESPVSVLQATRSQAGVPSQFPRIGFADAVPSDLGIGPWLGNLVVRSNDFSNVIWTKVASTITSANNPSPDGLSTATLVTITGLNARLFQEPLSSAGIHTFSMWVKSSVPCRLNLKDRSTDTIRGTTLIPVLTGWNRFSVTALCQNIGGARAEIGFDVSTGTVQIWGAQLVKAEEAGAYTPTVLAKANPGVAPYLPSNEKIASYNVGDRLENTTWDGIYSKPATWVCIQGGSPGVWANVNCYDSYNSNNDPHLYSRLGLDKEWNYNNGGGSGAIILENGTATFTLGSSTYIQLETTPAFKVRCCVQYEIVTLEVFAKSLSVNVTAKASDTSFPAISPVSGSQTKDTVITDPTYPGLFRFPVVGDAVLTKLLVRPKYPFLNKTPASFASSPTDVPTTSQAGLIDTWYKNASATFAAGVMTFTLVNAYIWEQLASPLVPGKTYRARINVTASPATSRFQLVLDAQAGTLAAPQLITLDAGGTTGIKEVTFTVNAGTVFTKIAIYSNGTVFNNALDYIRLYSE